MLGLAVNVLAVVGCSLLGLLCKKIINDKIETVFLMADAKYSFVSSSMAKQVISLGGNGEMLVPENVLKRMKGRAY